MNAIIKDIRLVVKLYSKKFAEIPALEFIAKPNPAKWSRQEVVGHLIDSAQNNLRRFIVGQYQFEPNILYEQEFWVQANNYQQEKQADIIELWKLVNKQICLVLASMPKENYFRLCNTGRETPSLHSIEWLAADYVRHLKHHINQVIPGSFDGRYP